MTLPLLGCLVSDAARDAGGLAKATFQDSQGGCAQYQPSRIDLAVSKEQETSGHCQDESEPILHYRRSLISRRKVLALARELRGLLSGMAKCTCALQHRKWLKVRLDPDFASNVAHEMASRIKLEAGFFVE